MIGTVEYDEMLVDALKGLYFETDQEELLKEPLEMKARMEMHKGRTMRQWEDMGHLIARQPVDSRPAQMLFHQCFQNAFLEANHNISEMEKRTEGIGKDGMQSFVKNYLRGSEERAEDLSKRMERLQQLQHQHKQAAQITQAATQVGVKKIPVTGGLATVANDFMPASKTISAFASSNNAKKVRKEVDSDDEPSIAKEGLSKESSIQSTFGYYALQNQQPKKPKAFQPPTAKSQNPAAPTSSANSKEKEEINDERLTGIDPKLIEIITSEVISLY